MLSLFFLLNSKRLSIIFFSILFSLFFVSTESNLTVSAENKPIDTKAAIKTAEVKSDNKENKPKTFFSDLFKKTPAPEPKVKTLPPISTLGKAPDKTNEKLSANNLPVASKSTVQIYLKNGDDLKGQLIAYQPNTLFVKTNVGVRALNLKYYHGLILDTPEEQLFGSNITHKEAIFTTAMDYTQKVRPLLNKQLQTNLSHLPDVCKPKRYPMLHMRFDKNGKVLSSQLLTRSDCPHLNLAIAQTVKQVNFPALPKDYPLNIYVFNYFFPTDAKPVTTAVTGTKQTLPTTSAVTAVKKPDTKQTPPVTTPKTVQNNLAKPNAQSTTTKENSTTKPKLELKKIN